MPIQRWIAILMAALTRGTLGASAASLRVCIGTFSRSGGEGIYTALLDTEIGREPTGGPVPRHWALDAAASLRVASVYRDGTVATTIKGGREEGVPVMDPHRVAAEMCVSIGDEAGADLDAGGPNDRAHFSETGARLIAGGMVSEIHPTIPSLAPFLKKPQSR